jgi:tetratricopeptide (TPR) repeat protein
MTRSPTWILGTLALALAASLLALARSRPAQPLAQLDELHRRIEALESQRPKEQEPPATEAVKAVADRLAGLDRRLASLESDARRVPVEAAAPRAEQGSDSAAERSLADPAARRREFEALLALFGPDFDFTGTPEEMQRFYELAREGDLLADSIAQLEARIAGQPADLEGRMELAGLYVAKLMTLPNGPEQGIWGTKAEEQWREVVELDPDHWKANFSLGNNFAYYPDVLGKTNEAIRYLEEARRIQELGEPRGEQVQVYLALSRLHLRQGDRDRARAVLESGLLWHPTDSRILQALEELGG